MKSCPALIEYLDIFAYNFRRLRYLHRQTQEYIARQTGLSEVTVNTFELGNTVTLTTVALIADHFKVRLSDFYKDREYSQEVLTLLKLPFVNVSSVPDELQNSFLNFFLDSDLVSQADFRRWIDYLEYRRAIYLVERSGIVNKFNKLVVGKRFHYDGRHHAFLFDLVSNTKEGTYLLSNKSGTHNCTRLC